MPHPAPAASHGPAATRSLFRKAWDDHVVTEPDERNALLAIDRHLVHEVSSAEAFVRLRASRRSVASPGQTFATQGMTP